MRKVGQHLIFSEKKKKKATELFKKAQCVTFLICLVILTGRKVVFVSTSVIEPVFSVAR